MRVAPEGSALGQKDPNAALILGYSPPPAFDHYVHSVYKLDVDFSKLDVELQKSITEVKSKSLHYRIHGFAGPMSNVHSQAVIANDLTKLDQTFRPTQISVWYAENIVKRVQVRYANGNLMGHGASDKDLGPPTHELNLASDGSEVIYEVCIKTAREDGTNNAVIAAFSVATSLCKVLDTSAEPTPPPVPKPQTPTAAKDGSSATKPDEQAESTKEPKKEDSPPPPPPSPPKKLSNLQTYTYSVPDLDWQWSFRGLFSVTHANTLTSFGIVWGKDQFVPVPTARISPPLCADFLALSPDLRKSIASRSIPGPKAFPGKFIMGHSVTTAVGSPDMSIGKSVEAQSRKSTYFNALDTIDFNWRIKTLAFHAKDGRLLGIKTEYFNGVKLSHGICDEQTCFWTCDVKSDLVTCKLTAWPDVPPPSPSTSTSESVSSLGRIASVEFIRANAGGRLPEWLLDVSTLRYIGTEEEGKGEKAGVDGVKQVVEKAPKMGGANWCVRGFYGEVAAGRITRLGVVWGRG